MTLTTYKWVILKKSFIISEQISEKEDTTIHFPLCKILVLKTVMEQKHQNVIKANYSTLVKKMVAVSVAGHLYNSNIITEEMREQIEAEKTNYDKSRKLISIILGRGSRAFMGLRTALMKANQADLSRLLMKKDDDTKTEYERKLDMARSLVICTKERGGFLNEAKKTDQHSHEPRCRIPLDDFNDVFLTVMPFKGGRFTFTSVISQNHMVVLLPPRKELPFH